MQMVNNKPSCASLVAAIRHLPRDSSRLYGIDHDSVNTLFSNSYKYGTGNSNVSSFSGTGTYKTQFKIQHIIDQLITVSHQKQRTKGSNTQ